MRAWRGWGIRFQEPLLKAAAGGSVASVAIEHLKGKAIEGILGRIGSLAYGLEAVNAAMWVLDRASTAAGEGLAKISKIEDHMVG